MNVRMIGTTDPRSTSQDTTYDPRARPKNTQGACACVVLGLAALVVQFLSALRLWCAKDVAVQRRFAVTCTLMAALDFVFTGLALLVWKASRRLI